MRSKIIYLDNNATTQLAPEVLQAMHADLSDVPLNPSSIHPYGIKAKNLLLKAKDCIAKHFSIGQEKILFTSGGTESLNHAILGFLEGKKSGHILTTATEHPAIYNLINALSKKGFEVSWLDVESSGQVSVETVRQAIKENTSLMVFSWVNTETGVINNVEALAALAKQQHIPLVIDGIGALGKLDVSFYDGISALCFSAHKIHGPKGIGMTLIQSKAYTPQLLGGPQENSLRAGTENLAGILGFAKAIELLKDQNQFTSIMQQLKDLFETKLKQKLLTIEINGNNPRICNTSNIYFPNISAETLLIQLNLQGVYASYGSACASGFFSPSRILLNMGMDKRRALGSVRFSLSRYTTNEEIERAVTIIERTVKALQAI